MEQEAKEKEREREKANSLTGIGATNSHGQDNSEFNLFFYIFLIANTHYTCNWQLYCII